MGWHVRRCVFNSGSPQLRQVKDIKDVNIVLKQLLDWQSQLQTKDQDIHQNRIRNAADATLPGDYVTLRQLPTTTITAPTPDQHFMIVFSSIGPVAVGNLSAGYTVGNDRVGQITEVWVSATVAPTTPATFNLTLNGSNILASDIQLPGGSNGPIQATNFVQPTPFFGVGTVLLPVVTAAGGASFVSLQVQVLRKVKSGS